MTKSEMRSKYLEQRMALTPFDLNVRSDRIADRFFSGVELSAVRCLHSFLPVIKFNEIDTTLILQRIWAGFSHILTVVPRTDLKTGGIESIPFSRGTLLVNSRWGIPEPSTGVAVDAGVIDMVLVPLLCFDKTGHRVGYGKGYYDRFLSSCRADCIKIGLSLFPAVDAISDVGDHDIHLDMAVTPDAIEHFPLRA